MAVLYPSTFVHILRKRKSNRPRREKTCLRGVANYTGADQPAYPRSLVRAFVIRFLESTICKLASGEILTFQLVSVVEETGLKLAMSETPKTGFVASRPKCNFIGSSEHSLLDSTISTAILVLPNILKDFENASPRLNPLFHRP